MIELIQTIKSEKPRLKVNQQYSWASDGESPLKGERPSQVSIFLEIGENP